jgi:hypothetical protein
MVWAHNNISTGSGILLVFISITVGNPITALTYGGRALTLKQTYAAVLGDLALWYLTGPPTGVNNVTLTQPGAQSICGISVDYSGVDQGNPFGTIKGLFGWANNGGPALFTEDLATQNTWTCVDAAYNGRNAQNSRDMIEGAGQTNLGRETFFDGVNNSGGIEVSDEASVGGTTTMSWTLAALTDHWGHIAAPLRPAVSARGRAVKYFFPFWNAAPELFDANGKIVSISDIQKDVWVEAQGLGMPTAENPETFIQDPSRSKIIEVNASQVSARIKTNKNQFAEVLVSRVAAGS